MYLIRVNSSSCLKTKRQYYYLIIEFQFYVIVNSLICITVTNVNNLVDVYIIDVYNYTSIFLENSTLFLFILYFLLHTKNLSYIEVNTFNINAFSLYLWLGYQILYKRLGYYLNNEKKFNTNSYAAYTLNNNKLYCKNTLRRFLMLLNT